MVFTAQKPHPVSNYLNLSKTASDYLSVYQKLYERYACIQVCRETRCLQPDFHRYRNINFFYLKNHKPYIYSFLPMQRFHTSSQCRALPMAGWVLLSYIAKLGVMIFGRKFNKWLKAQPDALRSYYRRRLLFGWLVGISLLGLASVGYYRRNLEETPVTHRKRFMTNAQEQLHGLFDIEIDNFLQSDWKILRATNPKYKKVSAIVKRLVKSNQDIFPNLLSTKFAIQIRKDNRIPGAEISQTGQVALTTGFFKLCNNDDKIAACLSHEIVHYALSHHAERYSGYKLINYIYIFGLMVPIWTFIPRISLVVFAQLVCIVLKSLFVYQPFLRRQEKEADIVGLQMMAKACYDVRETSVVFTEVLEYVEERLERLGIQQAQPQWNFLMEVWDCFSSHPSFPVRIEYINMMIPELMKLRRQSKCPRQRRDPRLEYARRGKPNRLIAAMKEMKT